MITPKQGHLHGAYYSPKFGASPLDRSNHSAFCTVSTLFKLIVFFVIILCVAVLAVLLLLKPSNLEFQVESAYVSRFNLTSTNVLDYNLKLVLSISNTNRKISIYYEELEAVACYGRENFGFVGFPAFYQEAKNITMVYAAFTGQSAIVLDSSIVRDFNKQSSKRLFHIDIKLYTKIRFRVGHLKLSKYSPKVNCGLMVPLAPSRSSGGGSFTRTKCGLKLLF